MNIEINYNYKFYLWGIAKPHRLWSMKLHVSSPTSEPPTIVRSNKHGDVMGLSWGYDDSGCGIYIYIVLVELGQYGSNWGLIHHKQTLYEKSINELSWLMGGFILAGGHSHDSGTLLIITPDPSKKRHVQWTPENDQLRVQNSSLKVIEKIHDVCNVGDPR